MEILYTDRSKKDKETLQKSNCMIGNDKIQLKFPFNRDSLFSMKDV